MLKMGIERFIENSLTEYVKSDEFKLFVQLEAQQILQSRTSSSPPQITATNGKK